MIKNYRLGLDLGTNSIGWSVIELDDNNDPINILDGNSRIFSDGRTPKSKSSLALTRTEVRQARRQRDRFLKRKKQLFKFLIKKQLMPVEKEHQKEVELLDPYKLRYEALDRPLKKYELGRVLFVLCQRRGYKSNRKECIKKKSTYLDGLNSFEEKFKKSGWRTIGEYFWKEKQIKLEGDLKHNIERVYGVKYRGEESDSFPVRKMYEDEFDYIQKKQQLSEYISSEDWAKIRAIIYTQRPLKPVEKGYCSLYYAQKKKRAYKALPSAEKFRVLQDIHNLRIIDDKFEPRPLTDKQRATLIPLLTKQNSITFNKIKKLLNLGDIRFNFEPDKKKLEGMKTTKLLSGKTLFSEKWHSFSESKKNKIVSYLLEANEESDIKEKAVTKWGVTDQQAKEIATLDLSKFSSGTIHFCVEALEKLNHLMEHESLNYYEAREQLAPPQQTEIHKELPYYGYAVPESLTNSGEKRTNNDEKNTGIIGNPTVHIGLNQTRKVVNAVINMMGSKPREINLEIARDLKMSVKKKKMLNTFQTNNKKLNKEIESELKDLKSDTGIEIINNYDTRLKYKLWKELKSPASCVYTGNTISISQLYSDDIQVEHILPLSRTWDDSNANKILSYRSANTKKSNKTPFEAWGNTDTYEDILERIKILPKNKQWRFHQDAMDQFSEEKTFLQKQLHDTQYLSKIAHTYLSLICDNVRVITGRLTAKLRHDWGIDKNRTDHRHHFFDAVVIGLTDTRTIQLANIKNKQDSLQAINFPCPINIKKLHSQFTSICKTNIISHRLRHSKNGQFHKETAYGFIEPNKDQDFNLVCRKEVSTLFNKKTKRIDTKHIRDPKIRKDLEREQDNSKKDPAEVLSDYAKKNNIKRVRVLIKDRSAKHISHNEHTKWVIPGDIHHIKLWKLPNGEVKGVGVSLFDINEPGYGTKSFRPKDKNKREIPTAKYITKVHKNDTISLIYENKKNNIVKNRYDGIVTSLRPANGSLMFVFPYEINDEKNFKSLSFSHWIKKDVKIVNINVLGKQK